MLADYRLKISVTKLIACTRVDSALIWESLSVESKKRFEASEACDALIELINSAFLNFLAPLSICDPCSAHSDEVYNAFLEEVLSNFRLTDNGYRDNRDLYRILDRLNEWLSPSLRE